MNELLTVPEVAAILRKTKGFVCDELTRKNLRGSKIGREWRIARDDLDRYIAAKANLSRSRRAS